jgi:uncharacterized membrane protein YdjX (TVP38/TMEM64 family)
MLEWIMQVERTAEWLKDFGIWAILVSLLLNIVISLLGVVPSLFLSGANAVVFGMVPGFFVSLTGEVAGAGISFWLYRWGVKKITKEHTTKWKWLQHLDSSNRRRKNMILFIARVTPLIPSGVITFAAAASNMLFLEFLVVTLIGKSPSIAMETIIGHDLIFLNENIPRLVISLLLVSFMIILIRGRSETN